MENYFCDNHRAINEKIFLDDENVILPNCNKCPKQNTRLSVTSSGNLFNIESVRNVIRSNPIMLTTNSTESRLSLNSGDSVDAPLLLNERYNEFEGMDEFHCHSDFVQISDNKSLKKLLAASCMCLTFMIIELVGGYLANSLSVMTDAAHLSSDFVGFLISLFSIWLGQKPRTKRMTWGFHRAEVLGALFSITVIWLLTTIFMYLAVVRLVHGKYDIDADTMMIVSALGVGINIIMGFILHGPCISFKHKHSHRHSHKTSMESQGNINVRAAVIHVLGDFIQSVGVLIASIIIKIYPDAKIADPICTFVFSIIVIITTKNVLRDTLIVLMEAVPLNIDYNYVYEVLKTIEGVRHVHDLRIWVLTTGKNSLTAHIAVDKFCDREELLSQASKLLRTKFPITFVTIQVEKYNENTTNNCIECQHLK